MEPLVPKRSDEVVTSKGNAFVAGGITVQCTRHTVKAAADERLLEIISCILPNPA